MKCVVQVVDSAQLSIKNNLIHSIGKGIVVFVGFTHNDHEILMDKMIEKILTLRIFPDGQGKTNLALKDIDGEILCIPNFTLYANVEHSRRPSFTDAANPVEAAKKFAYFQSKLTQQFTKAGFGTFGEDMSVIVHNQGPFTLILERHE
jgi:D-aminoacyl-tRNA deacylase